MSQRTHFFAASLCTFIGLGAIQAHAQTLITIGDIVSAAPGGSGSFDVVLTTTDGVSVGSFTAEPYLVSGSGLSFTGADFSTNVTTAPYIFPDSFDQANMLTLSDEVDDPFPNTDLIAADSDNSSDDEVTVPAGTAVGLAHITYNLDASDTPGETYMIDFNSDGTSLSDSDGSALDFATAPGAITAATASAAPEPSQVATLALVALGIGGLLVRARRRLRSS